MITVVYFFTFITVDENICQVCHELFSVGEDHL